MAPRGAGHDAAKTARQPLAARLIHKLLRQILPGGKGRPHWQDPPNAASLRQGPPHADRSGAGRILFPGKGKNGSGVGIVRLGTGPARNHLWQDPPNAANLCQGPPHADRPGAGWILFPGKEKKTVQGGHGTPWYRPGAKPLMAGSAERSQSVPGAAPPTVPARDGFLFPGKEKKRFRGGHSTPWYRPGAKPLMAGSAERCQSAPGAVPRRPFSAGRILFPGKEKKRFQGGHSTPWYRRSEPLMAGIRRTQPVCARGRPTPTVPARDGFCSLARKKAVPGRA